MGNYFLKNLYSEKEKYRRRYFSFFNRKFRKEIHTMTPANKRQNVEKDIERIQRPFWLLPTEPPLDQNNTCPLVSKWHLVYKYTTSTFLSLLDTSFYTLSLDNPALVLGCIAAKTIGFPNFAGDTTLGFLSFCRIPITSSTTQFMSLYKATHSQPIRISKAVTKFFYLYSTL